MLLNAATLALTAFPVNKVKGEALSADIGIVQDKFAITVASDPLQFVVS